MLDGCAHIESDANNQTMLIFKPASWLAKIDFINHLILFNNVLITILSDKEGGKTAFSSLLQANLDQQIKYLSLSVETPCDRAKMISTLCTQLHLNFDCESSFEQIARQVNQRKAHVLFIIDEAHQLPESLLKEILQVIKNQDEFGFFHICLISDHSIVATLNHLAEDQFLNLIHTIEVGTLSESETKAYVLERMMGNQLIKQPITDEQFKQFYQLTKGNFAKINHHMDNFFLTINKKKKKFPLSSLKRFSLAIFAFFVVGASYLYRDNVVGNPQKILHKQPSYKRTSLVTAENKPSELEKQQLPSYIASWEEQSTRQFVQYEMPKKQVLQEGVEEEKINNIALVDKVVYIPSVQLEKYSRMTENTKDSVELVEHADISKTIIKPALAKTIIKNRIKSIHKSNKFTIQIVASHKISDIHKLRQSKKILSQTTVRQFSNNRGVWYILTIGEFDTRNQAELAINKLPGELAKLKPWIRPVLGLENVG